MPHITPLEANQPIAKLIVLSDSSGFSGGSIEDGNEPSNSHPSGNTNRCVGLTIIDTNVGPSSLELVEANQDELKTLLLVKTF